jgi:tRNA(Ile)-lysidine synthase
MARRADRPLATRVADRIGRLVPEGATCLVAVSGGPDSLALLDLLHLAAGAHCRKLIVGHVDHGISSESAAVAELVREAAAARGLDCVSRHLNLDAATSETRARTARRAALIEMANAVLAQAIVVAHHADDQAETVLLRLLRGSGPAGLAGMAARQGKWVRPMLDIRRVELEAHLKSRSISAWRDPANADRRHLRSWLRGEVLPLLLERLPDLVECLGLAGRQAAEARIGWTEVVGQLPALAVARTKRGISVAAPPLRGYRSELRHAVLAAIGRELGVPLGRRRLGGVDRLLFGSAGSAHVDLAAGFGAELAFDRLTFGWNHAAPRDALPLTLERRVTIGAAEFGVAIGASGVASRDGWTAAVTPARYMVRTWRAGDRIRPLGGAGSRPVSVLLREARVVPSQRQLWPVVVTEDDATIVWVPGICRSDVAVPPEGIEAWIVECAFT